MLDINYSLNQLRPVIGVHGGRYFLTEEGKKMRLNDLTKTLHKLSQDHPSINLDAAIRRVRELDQEGENALSQANMYCRVATIVRRFFGNMTYHRYPILQQLQFPNQNLATSLDSYRLLSLKGEDGVIKCRVRGLSKNLLPTRSENGVFEYFYRTYARTRNLTAVRGSEEGSRMLGPCDYFGNLEKPHLHEYTIQIKDGVPVFMQQIAAQNPVNVLKTVQAPATRLDAQWLSAGDPLIAQINPHQQLFGESLFENKGILRIGGGSHFEIERFDAREVDLSPYKARLVSNSDPFHITKVAVPSSDDYRVVTYKYETNYAEKQVREGGGLFVETHSFAQTITPLEEDSKGFVTLARWTNEKRDQLDLIGVEIPFGFTLVVEEFAIHGDTNLDGMFIMCMTSNHVTMQTADTVFLKNSETHANISLTIRDA